jgi:hypothetical protein
MSGTRRVPLARRSAAQITPAAMEAFRRIRSLEAQCTCLPRDWEGEYWRHEPCPACDEWWTQQGILCARSLPSSLGTGQRSNTRKRRTLIPSAQQPPPRGAPTWRRGRCGVYSTRPPASRAEAVGSEHAEVALRPKRRRPSKKNPHRDRQGQVTRRSRIPTRVA